MWGITVSGCTLNGKWGNDEGYEYRFYDGKWEYSWQDGTIPVSKGTFDVSGGIITMQRTQIHGTIAGPPLMIELSSAWHSKDTLESAMLAEGFTPELANEALDRFFAPQSENYSINGNTLVLTLFGEEETWTRR